MIMYRKIGRVPSFFDHTAPTDSCTLSLHDALPISAMRETQRTTEIIGNHGTKGTRNARGRSGCVLRRKIDRKSTRLNSSHTVISYAVFCLKKKKNTARRTTTSTAIPMDPRRVLEYA